MEDLNYHQNILQQKPMSHQPFQTKHSQKQLNQKSHNQINHDQNFNYSYYTTINNSNNNNNQNQNHYYQQQHQQQNLHYAHHIQTQPIPENENQLLYNYAPNYQQQFNASNSSAQYEDGYQAHLNTNNNINTNTNNTSYHVEYSNGASNLMNSLVYQNYPKNDSQVVKTAEIGSNGQNEMTHNNGNVQTLHANQQLQYQQQQTYAKKNNHQETNESEILYENNFKNQGLVHNYLAFI